MAKSMRHLCAQEIKTELTRFKGVGKKTVACVLMFCLDRQGISSGVCASGTLSPLACPPSDPASLSGGTTSMSPHAICMLSLVMSQSAQGLLGLKCRLQPWAHVLVLLGSTLAFVWTCCAPRCQASIEKVPGLRASCAACRHEFPVDTHVWRITKSLGWVPQKASRDQTYAHLNARVPDNIK